MIENKTNERASYYAIIAFTIVLIAALWEAYILF